MRRFLLALPLSLAATLAHANTPECAGVPQTLPLRAGMTTPLAAELYSAVTALGAPAGVLAQQEAGLTVDQVLLRMRIDACRAARAAASPATLDPNDPSVYQPRTAHDNTPWRFNMTQNGKRMTADEFDAWMRSRGIRIAGRRQTAEPAATTQQGEGQAAGEATRTE